MALLEEVYAEGQLSKQEHEKSEPLLDVPLFFPTLY